VLIRDSQEIDDFFMERVWNFKEREIIHNFSKELLGIYTELLAKHLGLPFRDTYHLTQENGYHSISAFIDTTYRLKKYQSFSVELNDSTEFRSVLDNFFSEEVVSATLGYSRNLRCNIANLILQSLGLTSLFNDNKQEPEQIQLEDLGLVITSQEKYWRLHHNLTHRIPNAVVQYSKSYWNRFQQQFSKIHMRIGLIPRFLNSS